MFTILAIKEKQIKITLRFYITPVTISSRTPPTTNVGEDIGKKEPYTLLVGM
jgi:hypothetical protein